jgi:hypothetical protein
MALSYSEIGGKSYLASAVEFLVEFERTVAESLSLSTASPWMKRIAGRIHRERSREKRQQEDKPHVTAPAKPELNINYRWKLIPSQRLLRGGVGSFNSDCASLRENEIGDQANEEHQC